jgi:hypothetical protein
MASLASMPSRSRMTNLAQPVQPRPLVAPNLPPSPTAPSPTATPGFQAPDPSRMAQDPYYQARLNATLQGSQRSAAAHGSLLSGGFQVSLGRKLGELASAEGDKIYGRALNDYTTNRDTNAQNYGQSLAGFGAQRSVYGDARDAALQQADVTNANGSAQDAYGQQMADYNAWLDEQRAEDARRQNEATSAMQRRPIGPSLGYHQPMPVLR